MHAGISKKEIGAAVKKIVKAINVIPHSNVILSSVFVSRVVIAILGNF